MSDSSFNIQYPYDVYIYHQYIGDGVAVSGFEDKVYDKSNYDNPIYYESYDEGVPPWYPWPEDAVWNYRVVNSDVCLVVPNCFYSVYYGNNNFYESDFHQGVTANNTIVESGGVFRVDGTANYTTINSGGVMSVVTYLHGDYTFCTKSRATANYTTVNSGGRLTICAVASHVTVNKGGYVTFNSTVWDGYFNGKDVIENGGYVNITGGNVYFLNNEYKEKVTFASNTFSAVELTSNSATVHSGTTAVDTIINDSGRMEIYWGGEVNTTTVNSGGSMQIIGNSPYPDMEERPSNTVISDTTINGGTVFVNCATLNRTTVTSGKLTVQSGGIANNTTMVDWGNIDINNTAIANNTMVYSGSIRVSSATANNTTIQNARMTLVVGSANSTTVNPGGSMSIDDLSTATEIIENGGLVEVEDGADVSFASNAFAGLSLSEWGASATVHSGTTANWTTIASYARMTVFSGGTADDTTAYSMGFLFISSGGVANRTLLSGGVLYVSSGGTANSTLVDFNGWMKVSSGGVANSTIVSSGGYCAVSSGGTASDCTVYTGGSLYLGSGAHLEGVTTIGCHARISFSEDTDIPVEIDGTINLLLDAPADEYSSANPFIYNFDAGFGTNTDTTKNLSVTATDDTSAGVYLLAQGVASDYTSSVSLTVKAGETVTEYEFVWNEDIQTYDPITVGTKTYTLSRETMRGENNSKLCFTVTEDTISDAAYEYIARKLAYSDRPLDMGGYYKFVVNEEDGPKTYFFRVEKIWNSKNANAGFDAILLERVDAYLNSMKQAVLACGGTEIGLTKWADIKSDLLDDGIGSDQYEKNRHSVYGACQRLIAEGCSLSMTGHSLGGALAQWFTVFSADKGGISQIENVVTFNSPGLPQYYGGSITTAENDVKIKRIRHYVNDGDLVSMAGEYYLSHSSDAAYTLFANTNTFTDPFDYGFIKQHTDTLFFLDSLAGKPNKDPNLRDVVYEETMKSLSSGNFSYLTISLSPYDSTNYSSILNGAMTVVSTGGGSRWLFNTQYAALILTVSMKNPSWANQLITRAGTEKSRKNLFTTAYKYISSDNTGKTITVGATSYEAIRSLTFVGENMPCAFFDFTNQKIIWNMQYLRRKTIEGIIINTSPLLPGGFIVKAVGNISQETSQLSEQSQFAIMIPEFANSNRFTLTSITSDKETSLSTNVFRANGCSWLYDNGSGSSEYSFTFTVDESVTAEKAVLVVDRQTISADTEELDIFISDIDASIFGNTMIFAVAYTDSDGIGVELYETEIKGLYRGTLDLSIFDLTDEDNLRLEYQDIDNGKGEIEYLTKTISIDNTEWPDLSEIDFTDPTISDITAAQDGGTVLVTAAFGDDADLESSLYKIGESGEWQPYAGGVTVSEAATVFFKAVDASGNETETSFDVALDNGFLLKDEGCIMNGEATGILALDGEIAAIENGTFYRAVFAGESITNDALADGAEVVMGDVDLFISDGTFDRLVTGGDCIVDSGSAIRCWTCSDEGDDPVYTKSVITLTIDGGVFSNNVVGGMAYMSTEYTGNTELFGDVYLTITGGTFKKYIYGGNTAANKNVSAMTCINGNVTVTLDASEKVISLNKLVAGSYNMGEIDGSTRIILTGDGDNIQFAETGEIWGGCGADYYLFDRTFESHVSGTRTLTFSGFENELAANRIRGFSHAEFLDGSSVKLTQSTYNLSDVGNWTFEYGSCIEDSDFTNNFTGDVLNLVGLPDVDTFQDWTVIESTNAAAFAGFDAFSSVTLGGETAMKGIEGDNPCWISETYKMFLDTDNSKIILTLA